MTNLAQLTYKLMLDEGEPHIGGSWASQIWFVRERAALSYD
jgi:hypothetical protein